MEKEGFEIDKKIMDIEDHIKETGAYDIQLNLFKDVKAHINLAVEGESSESEEEEKPSEEKEEAPTVEEKSSEEEKPSEEKSSPEEEN